MDSGKFDLIFVTDRFKSALESEDDISIEFYLQAFREILKFVYMRIIQTIFFHHLPQLQIFSSDGLNFRVRILGRQIKNRNPRRIS